jgi:hypothetical protein
VRNSFNRFKKDITQPDQGGDSHAIRHQRDWNTEGSTEKPASESQSGMNGAPNRPESEQNAQSSRAAARWNNIKGEIFCGKDCARANGFDGERVENPRRDATRGFSQRQRNEAIELIEHDVNDDGDRGGDPDLFFADETRRTGGHRLPHLVHLGFKLLNLLIQRLSAHTQFPVFGLLL